METIANEILTLIIKAIISVLLALIGKAVRDISKYLASKTEDTALKSSIAELDAAVQDGIDFVEQTVVKQSKANDNWNEKTQSHAKSECVRYILQALSQSTIDTLTDNCDDITEFILDKIESGLGRLHRE